VYVKFPHTLGTYNAAVTLKDKVRLVLENGAAGITVTIDSGATASLEDFHNFDFKRWDSGVLVGFQEDRSQAEEASFIIFKEGSFYFAKNGSIAGNIAFSGTNASQVIVNVINALAQGESVFVKAGNYSIDVALIDNGVNDITIRGEGRNTLFWLEDGAEAHVFDLSSVDGWTLRDFKIDANKDGQTSADLYGIRMVSVSNSSLINLHVKNANKTNLRLETGTDDLLVTRCLIEGSGWHDAVLVYGDRNIFCENTFLNNYAGVSVYSSATATIVTNNYFWNNTLNLYGATYSVVDGNHFKGVNAKPSSIQVDGIGGTFPYFNTISNNIIEYGGTTSGIEVRTNASYNTIVGNVIRYCTGSGIGLFYDANDNTITGNLAQYNDQHGVYLRGESPEFVGFTADYNVVADNILVNNGQNFEGHGVSLSNASYNIVSGNMVNSQDYGIRELTGSDRNIITGCYALSNAVVDIEIIGANTKVASCYNGSTWIP